MAARAARALLGRRACSNQEPAPGPNHWSMATGRLEHGHGNRVRSKLGHAELYATKPKTQSAFSPEVREAVAKKRAAGRGEHNRRGTSPEARAAGGAGSLSHALWQISTDGTEASTMVRGTNALHFPQQQSNQRLSELGSCAARPVPPHTHTHT